MTDDAKVFGALVRERRNALGLSQEALAAAAFSNAMRKGYISQIENGKIPNITRDTVRNVARALKIDAERIPPPLRWAEAVETVKDTNNIVHETAKVEGAATATQVSEMEARLLAAISAGSQAIALTRDQIIALARRITPETQDFSAALRELERAVEVFETVQREGASGSNLGDLVNETMRRIAELNQQSRFDEAADVATAAYERWKTDENERQKQARAEGLKLLEAGLNQDLLRRDPVSAANRIVERERLETPADELFARLRAVQDEWYVRGRDFALSLDLEVSVELARASVGMASTAWERGSANTDLGIALATLGERLGGQPGADRLSEALAVFDLALTVRTREAMPADWATTQNNRGNALVTRRAPWRSARG
jgi:transcriptional regulator with XRE-family HTH domain